MDQKELDKILELHKMWLNGDENGKCADLYGADLSGADLSGANLRGADLYGADLRGADLDFSCWPLWCGSLHVKIDDRIAHQLIYHVCSAIISSPEVSDSIKDVMLSQPVLDLANNFHRAQGCGILRRENDG